MVNLLHALFLTGALLSATLTAQAQNVAGSNFGLRISGSKNQRVVGLGDSKSRVIQVLGPPTKTSRSYSDIEEAWLPVLHYGRNRLYFSHEMLDYVELNDARLRVGKPGAPGFHVGSQLAKAPAAKLPLAFGLFSVRYQPGKSRNMSYSAISSGYMKTAKGEVADVLYEIQYDQQGRVTHIFLDSSYD